LHVTHTAATRQCYGKLGTCLCDKVQKGRRIQSARASPSAPLAARIATWLTAEGRERQRDRTSTSRCGRLFGTSISPSGRQFLNAGRNGGEYYTPRPLIRAMIKVLDPKIGERILDEAFEGIATARANAEKNLKNAGELFRSHLEQVFLKFGESSKMRTIEALTESDSPITYGVVKPGDEGGVPFVRGGDIAQGRVLTEQLRTIEEAVSRQYRRTLLRGGELLISLVGQPGQVAVAPGELAGANIARQVGLIRLIKQVDAEYVRYFLQSPVGQAALGAKQSGSVQQVINLGELRQVLVPLPVLSEQREVVSALDAFSAGVERVTALVKAKLAALDELKKSLLHQAFTGAL
jgi:type I restriction enzyme S subunit